MKAIALFEGTLIYSQDEDACDDLNSGSQSLTITLCDGGGGKYLIIKTDRWALDSVDELVVTLLDAKRRLGLEPENLTIQKHI